MEIDSSTWSIGLRDILTGVFAILGAGGVASAIITTVKDRKKDKVGVDKTVVDIVRDLEEVSRKRYLEIVEEFEAAKKLIADLDLKIRDYKTYVDGLKFENKILRKELAKHGIELPEELFKVNGNGSGKH